jgi:short subunit dehydrogenase-like uncharacterized protein
MSARIVLFGATGFTGRLTARALVDSGERPVLAGRSREKLEALAGSLGGDLDVQEASVDAPASVEALVSKGDVLISTVGPFSLYGQPALDAALSRQAHYIDSTGEPGFIRQVFAADDRARASGSLLLTAFGYDYIPGHAAGGVALERAARTGGGEATRVDIGYFWDGASRGGMSQGTMNSSRVAAMHPGMEFHGGRLVERFGALGLRTFDIDGRRREAISVGASEHYALPKSYPGLIEVNVYLGWFGKRSAAMSRGARVLAAVRKVPLLGALPAKLAGMNLRSEGKGPDTEARADGRSRIVAIAYDAEGRPLAEAELAGANGYDYTAGILAWGARRLRMSPPTELGARGPIEAFGLGALLDGCSAAGMPLQGERP